MNNTQNLKNKAKETTKEGKEKIDKTRQSSAWQKTKGAVKKGVELLALIWQLPKPPLFYLIRKQN